MDDFSIEPSGPNFFCSTLKERGEWAATVRQLLQSRTSKWREANLRSHDIELPVPQASAQDAQSFHLILLSPRDCENPAYLDRVDQLSNVNQGRNSAVVFFLDQEKATDAYQTFTKLQMRMLAGNSTTSIIPLTSVDALLPFLETFHASLVTSKTTHHPWPVDAANDLLPYCTVGPTPLPRQITQILGEHCLGFRELIGQLAEGSGGRDKMWETIGPESAEGVVSFWAHEFSAP